MSIRVSHTRDGKVTVVIATYMRADALRITLEALYRQTYSNWNALIIADCCSKDHLDQLQPLNKKVQYINLPVRCGQQYGPNSVGIYLADTEYIAFLNHDDIWLNDHLERAISSLNTERKNIYFGKAAFCHYQNQPAPPERLLFSEINRPEELWCSLKGPNHFFEPASSWVIKTKQAKAVGFWNSPDQVAHTPVMDWIMRLACNRKSKFAFGTEVTTLKFNMHHGVRESDSCEYAQPADWLPRLQRFVLNPANQTRAEISADLAAAPTKSLLCREHMDGKHLKMTAEMNKQKKRFNLFRFLGLLPQMIRNELYGKSGESFAIRVVAERTGEVIQEFPNVVNVIQALKSSNFE
jgi:glycosyltransferase involved in cell wall biosynthesis